MNPWDLSCRANNKLPLAPPSPPPLPTPLVVDTLNGEQLAMLAAAAQVASLDNTLKSKLLSLPPQRNYHHHHHLHHHQTDSDFNATQNHRQLDQHKITTTHQRGSTTSKQALTKNRLNSSPLGETLTKQATHSRNGPSANMGARVIIDQLPDLISSLVKVPQSQGRSSMFGPLSLSSSSTGSSSSSTSSPISYGSAESADDLSSDSRRPSTSSSTQISSTSIGGVHSGSLSENESSLLVASLDKRARKKDQNRRAAYNYRRKKMEERNRMREEEGRLVHIQVRLQGKIARLEERILVALGTSTRRIFNKGGCSICFQCPLCLQSCDNIMNLRNHLRLEHYPQLTTQDGWNNNRSRDQLQPQLQQYQRIFQNELINCNDSDNHHYDNINNNSDDLKFVNNNIIMDYINNVS